ncbi:MAG: hypothetical protein ACFFKA_21940, partial [Candidatus Thorarchaeota archaeon]
YDQSIEDSFSVFSDLPINYNCLEGVGVYHIDFEGQNYFKLCLSVKMKKSIIKLLFTNLIVYYQRRDFIIKLI